MERSRKYSDLDRIQPSVRAKKQKTAGLAVPGNRYCGKIVDGFPTSLLYPEFGDFGEMGDIRGRHIVMVSLKAVHYSSESPSPSSFGRARIMSIVHSLILEDVISLSKAL